MKYYFLFSFIFIKLAVAAQDFCSTTQKLIVAAADNFRNSVNQIKSQKDPANNIYISPYGFNNGREALIYEGKYIKTRQFRQILSENNDLQRFVFQLSECLILDDINNWKTSSSNSMETIYKNEKKGVTIFISQGIPVSLGGVTTYAPIIITFEKTWPIFTWNKSNKHIPYLLMTGSSDYIFVDSASMYRTDFQIYNLGDLSYYPGEPGIYPIFDNNKNETGYLFFDASGKMQGPSKGVARPFTGDLAWVRDYNSSLYYFIDRNNKPGIPPTYEDVWGFEEGLAAVMKNGKWGFIDKTGKVIIPLSYDAAYPFHEGLSPVKKEARWGFINKEGKEIITPKYDNVYFHFEKNICTVAMNNKWGLIDKTGKEIVPPRYASPLLTGDDAAVFSINKLYGFMDQTGKQIVPPRYQQLQRFYEGLAAFKKNGKWGYVNKNGKEVIPAQYDQANFFTDGLASVTTKGKTGYIDKTGKVIIAPVYDYIGIWREGLAEAKQNGKYGFIDQKGQVVIPFKYDAAVGFSYGLAAVKLNDTGAYFFIDRSGREYRQK